MGTLDRRAFVKTLMANPIITRTTTLSLALPLSANAAPPISDYIDIRAFLGGDGDITAALMHTKALNKSAWIAPGKYSVRGRIEQGDMTVKAASDAIVEATGSDSVVFHSSGDFLRLPRPLSKLTKGKSSLRVKGAHDLQPGDWLIVFDPKDSSWHASRPYYRAGEWCRIASVAAGRIALSQPLRADYAGPEIQLFLVTLRRPALLGGVWRCGERELAHYTACTGRLIDVMEVDAAANTAIYIDRCVEAQVQCRRGHNAGAGLDDYFICVGNSQSVRIYGEQFYSRRHPVAIGGGDLSCGVPCRDCIIEGVTLRNDPSTNLMCADIHGNSEDCAYVHCIIFGGISLGGANPTFRNCKVYARSDGTAAEATEFVGGKVDLTAIEITTYATHVGGGRGVIDIGTQNGAFNSSTRSDVTLSISDFSVRAPNLAQDEAIIRVRNTGSKARLNVRVSGGNLKLNQPVQFLRTELESGKDASKFIEITDIYGLPPRSQLHYAASGAYAKSVRKPQQSH